MFDAARSRRGAMHGFLLFPQSLAIFIETNHPTLLIQLRLFQEDLIRSDADMTLFSRALSLHLIAITHLYSFRLTRVLSVYMSVKIFSVRMKFNLRQDWSSPVGPYNSYRRQNCQSAPFQQFYRMTLTLQEAAYLSAPSIAWLVTMCQWVLRLPEVQS